MCISVYGAYLFPCFTDFLDICLVDRSQCLLMSFNIFTKSLLQIEITQFIDLQSA